jgi:hypothetical protein
MNRTALALAALSAAALSAALALAAPGSAPHANPSAQAQALHPAGSVSAAPEAKPGGSFEADPPAAAATPAPKPDEWKGAPVVALAHDVEGCRALRVREWIKIRCEGLPAAGASLLAGTRAGVELWVDPPKEPKEQMKTPRAAEVIFPVRRGDGRILQIGQFGEGYDGPVAWNLAYIISEQWIEGENAPIISVR